jgi:hypothetical protein
MGVIISFPYKPSEPMRIKVKVIDFKGMQWCVR